MIGFLQYSTHSNLKEKEKQLPNKHLKLTN